MRIDSLLTVTVFASASVAFPFSSLFGFRTPKAALVEKREVQESQTAVGMLNALKALSTEYKNLAKTVNSLKATAPDKNAANIRSYAGELGTLYNKWNAVTLAAQSTPEAQSDNDTTGMTPQQSIQIVMQCAQLVPDVGDAMNQYVKKVDIFAKAGVAENVKKDLNQQKVLATKATLAMSDKITIGQPLYPLLKFALNAFYNNALVAIDADADEQEDQHRHADAKGGHKPAEDDDSEETETANSADPYDDDSDGSDGGSDDGR
jgi:hypothetical protein